MSCLRLLPKRGSFVRRYGKNKEDLIDRFQRGLIRKSLIKGREGRQL